MPDDLDEAIDPKAALVICALFDKSLRRLRTEYGDAPIMAIALAVTLGHMADAFGCDARALAQDALDTAPWQANDNG